MGVGLIALLLGVVALLRLAIWSIKRHQDPHLELHTDQPLEELIPSLSGVAWVGGRCIVDQWLGDAQDRQHVRDLSVRLTGPVVSIDGAWCAIGSSNFDDRSFETNDEITVGFLDAALARRLAPAEG